MVGDKAEEAKWKGLGVNDHWQQHEISVPCYYDPCRTQAISTCLVLHPENRRHAMSLQRGGYAALVRTFYGCP